MAYQPASVVSTDPGLQHISNLIYFDKVAVENLKANLPFMGLTARKRLPMNSGKTLQIYSYNLLAANLTPGVEGTVGAGIAPSTVRKQAVIQQFFDFMSFSDVVKDTAIDPIVKNASAEMGYRAAQTSNTLVANAFAAIAAAAPTPTRIDLADNEFFNLSIVRQAIASLRGRNVRPMEGETWGGAIHPFVSFDLLNDNTAGGALDILKRNDFSTLQRGIRGYRIVRLHGVDFIETTTVPTTSNFPSSGKTGYHTYIVGDEALFTISLGATEIPNNKNFSLMVRNYDEPSPADPAAVIGATVAYKFYFATVDRPDGVSAFREIRGEAGVA